MSFSTTKSLPVHTEVKGGTDSASAGFHCSVEIFISLGVQILGSGYQKYRNTWKRDSITGLSLNLQTNAWKTE